VDRKGEERREGRVVGQQVDVPLERVCTWRRSWYGGGRHVPIRVPLGER
jgi:hypothetical protein